MVYNIYNKFQNLRTYNICLCTGRNPLLTPNLVKIRRVSGSINIKNVLKWIWNCFFLNRVCADSTQKNICHISYVMCHVFSVMLHVSHVMCHMFCVTSHRPHVLCHLSHVTCHISLIDFFILGPL